jgi:type II secretory pathway component PulF
MLLEFNSTELPFRWLFSTAPAIWILFFLTFIAVVAVPLLNRGHLFGLRLPRWVPTMPRLAERKADVLHGLADGVEAGWPIGRALAVGHSIATRSLERRSLDYAMRLIEQGLDPVEAIRRSGWIEPEEASWLSGTSPKRMAELLRSIARQDVRDARANLRWLMAMLFPLLVVLLGLCVMAYAFGFFAIMSELINGIA